MYRVKKKLEIFRNKELENYFGIKIDKIGYNVFGYDDESDVNEKGVAYIDFYCEITSTTGKKLEKFVYLHVAALNNKGEIIGCSGTLYLEPDEFYIEQVWAAKVYTNIRGLKALKIYIAHELS